MKPQPNYSPGAQDDMAITSSKLSWVDRIRLRLALPFLFLGVLILPSEFTEMLNEQTVVSQDEVQDGDV